MRGTEQRAVALRVLAGVSEDLNSGSDRSGVEMHRGSYFGDRIHRTW